MNTDPPTPENDANLSALGRELLDTGGSKPSGPWVPPTAEELHAILPQYEIVKMLGRGGMGAVYMGTQTALERPVAIKILSAQLEESDMGFTERFKNEAKAMAKLNHPGIVAVYDFGEAPGGLLYIVMEYVDGTDVAKMLAAKGRLHTEHAMAITAHVCDALSYAHERGIIHRDIKPANIMVGYDGEVKVADFGLAKVSTDGRTLGLTQSGMAMGTLHYMAPEALMLGSAVDHRADIYAVGVMLYQMLTGKIPQGMFKMPSLQIPGLDPRYDGIIAKGIMEDREARYQSAREMRSDLDGILTQPVVKVEPAAADAPAQGAMLPTNARPQRPGTRQPAPPGSTGAHTIPHETQRGSLAWLGVTALVLAVLGGVGWLTFGVPRQPVAATTRPLEDSTPPSPVIPEKTSLKAPTIAESTTPTSPVPVTASSSTPPAITETWQSLFNGKDLGGWRIIGNSRGFTVDQGTIMTGGVRADLIYTGSGAAPAVFRDFELRMQVKTGDKGNSGLWFHLPAGIQSTREADQSLQVQIDNGFDQQRTGSIVHLLPLDRSPVADGVWFELRVLVQNKTVTAFVDGKQVNQWTQPDNWNPPAKAALARMGTGTIGLESWKGNVWFQDIRLRSLEDSKSSAAPGEKLILGRWVRSNMDRAGDAYLMDLSADGSALWTGDNTTVRGTWQFKSGVLEVDWNSRFKFLITPPAATSSAILKGTANWPDGKSTEIVYERQTTGAGEPASLVNSFNGHRYQFVPGALTWIDAKAKSESMGGHLATITSKQENDFLLQAFQLQLSPAATTLKASMIWLGGIEEKPGAGWKWVTGEPFQFTAWMPGEPNGEKGGRGQIGHPFMLNFYSGGTEIGWNDNSADPVLASKMRGFIVEWDAKTPPAMSASTEDGFMPLFTNDSLSGWKGDVAGYRYANSTLTSTANGGDLISPKEYGSFHLKFDLRLSPGGNNGIGVWCSDKNQGYKFLAHTGFEIQLLDDLSPTYTTGKLWQSHGALTYFITPKAKPMGPPWSWNTHEIRMEGTKLTVIINNVTVIDQELPRGDPEAAGSRRHRLDLSKKRGHLVFCGMKGPVDFRNVMIKDLDAPKTVVPPPPSTPAPVASASTWIDTQGRSLQAKFVRIEGDNVLVNIAGKTTPVALASLSDASRQIAETLRSASLPSTSNIPSDALQFGTSCYAYYPGTLTWKEAKVKAEAMGGHLATITTAAEDAWVVTSFQSKVTPSRKQFWIGASQERPHLPWQWVTGEPFSYTQWAPGEPNNAKGTDLKSNPPFMLGYLFQGGRMGWNDFSESQANWRDVIVGYLVEWDNAAATADTGWATLFPNDSLAGWTGDTAAYRVSGGIVTGFGRGNLISPKEYGSFHLKFDLRLSTETNSGIGIWRDPVVVSTAAAARGFEVQVQDDSAPKYKQQEFWQRHGGIYYFKEPIALAMGPPGSWNTHEIRMEGSQLKITINGKLVQDVNITQLRPQVSRAPVLNVSRRSGHLVLLGRNGIAEFRNMQIKELP